MKYAKLVREIYYRYTDLVEPFGMDECWLDVTGSTGLFGSGSQIAHKIREQVKKETGLTVSIGVSFNKIFAKLGSDMKKPDAVTCIEKDTFKEQIWPLPVSNLLSVGRATASSLSRYGIKTIGDLANTDPKHLRAWFGVNGAALWRYANGLDDSRVTPFGYKSPVKSIGHGITCVDDLVNEEEVWKVMLELTQDISHKLRANELLAGGVSVALKDNTFYCKEYQCKISEPSHSTLEIAKKAFRLFQKNYKWQNHIRAVTVRVINLVPEHMPRQISLFSDETEKRKIENIESAIEKIHERFGRQAVTYACLLGDLKMPKTKDEELIISQAIYA